ncbi:hypothetical protein PVAND_004885 [Polypedilum vanderplanki]|uniref:Uncharacterized protein n=1 Tax=Polypedilum vanderplanki TaxID=319348 RepID=A0A9J6BZE9_POLVA|nr:hypothetical protein PVAND_004885 [Polypedilum vanderplanki]
MNNSSKNSRRNTTKPVPKKKAKQQQQKANEGKGNNKANGTNKNNDNAKQDVEIPKSKKAVDEVTKKITEEPKKLERSNSFIERAFSKIYNKLSDSIENLAKIGTKESNETVTTQQPSSSPFKFQRSLTLNSFQLKKNYRKTILENPRLEKLSEEKISETEKTRTPTTPPKSPSPRSRSPTTFRQSMPIGTFDNVDFFKLPPKLERSDSFISLIKRKISFNENKTPSAPSMNSNWAMSLQNLQQIDNMVSYEDLSFVDYDKFNTYERKIDKILTHIYNMRTSTMDTNDAAQVNETESESALNNSNVSSKVILRRRIKKVSSVGDFNKNLDREKNLYRQSIDSNKLKFLSSINLDSHRWSQIMVEHNDPLQWLSLENKQSPGENLNLISNSSSSGDAILKSSSTSLIQNIDTNSILSLHKTIVPRKVQSCENLFSHKFIPDLMVSKLFTFTFNASSHVLLFNSIVDVCENRISFYDNYMSVYEVYLWMTIKPFLSTNFS